MSSSLNILTDLSRRKFISHTTKVIGSVVLLYSPLAGIASGLQTAGPITVGQVMDTFISEVPGAPFPNTVDTLKSGNRDMVVTGIVTTMFATIEVIRKAIAIGANFIIAHEPTFYNHQDATKWIENDEVYKYKAALLKDNNISVWRNHDYIHSLVTDGVMKGVVEKLGWQKFGDPKQFIYDVKPAPSLKDLIGHLKKRLDISMVRYIGSPEQQCGKVLLIPGAAGATKHIMGIEKYKPDVLICGEMSEWETAEYIRDARAKGQQISMVVLGHIASEEPGSDYMISWLKDKFPAIKATHIPPGNSLSFM